ncbi:hypothetical protein AAVH_33533, partial [Aphelenchoides avenae]
PRDLEAGFVRCTLTHGCRDFKFSEGTAAPLITDKSILELFFGEDPYNRPRRFLLIEEPTLSATFVRDCIQRHLSCTDNFSVHASITGTPPPQEFDEVEQYRAISYFEFHVYTPTSMLIRWLPLFGKMTIQRFEGRLF